MRPHLQLSAVIAVFAITTLTGSAWCQSKRSATRSTVTEAGIIGAYYEGDGLGRNANPALNANHAFTYAESGDTGNADYWAGAFEYRSGLIVLEPLWPVSRPTMEEASRHSEDVSSNKGESWALGDLSVVPWGKRIYLLEQDDFRSFSNAVNLGREPRGDIHGHYFLRVSDRKLPDVSGSPGLPDKWMANLLPKPVTGKVVKIERTNRKTEASGGRSSGTIVQVTIDVGSKQGIKPGMAFYFPGTPAFIKKYLDGELYVKVASVVPDSCVAEFTTYIDEYPMDIGTKASTRSPEELVKYLTRRRG